MPSTSRTRSLVMTGLSIALIAVGAFITVPFGPIPFTLQTMMIGIVMCLLPPVYSVAAIGGYLALGCLGLPVFSGFRGGIGVLAGPTGGFLIGYLLAAVVIALIRSRLYTSADSDKEAVTARPSWFLPVLDGASLVVLSVIYFTCGCLWFMVSTAVTLEAALVACVFPFIITDIFKAVVAFISVRPVRTALGLGLVPVRYS